MSIKIGSGEDFMARICSSDMFSLENISVPGGLKSLMVIERSPGTLIFSNENMSDEQILAMKSSPEPILIDISQNRTTQVAKPARSNVSVTSIKAGGSRIPIRAVPEPTQRKTKRENYVSFSSLNVSPANDKRHTNGSGENSITHIVLDSQK
uniref:Uncharacterized protein n=1 Tax=Cuerna arida TaxID=1464854 RepID=A0A1B6GZI5_9HEMI